MSNVISLNDYRAAKRDQRVTQKEKDRVTAINHVILKADGYKDKPTKESS